MQGDDQRGTLGTVRNATLLLSLLAEGPAYNQLTDLAERSGMSLPTVHRLAATAFGRVVLDAGLPPGVFNVVHGGRPVVEVPFGELKVGP